MKEKEKAGNERKDRGRERETERKRKSERQIPGNLAALPKPNNWKGNIKILDTSQSMPEGSLQSKALDLSPKKERGEKAALFRQSMAKLQSQYSHQRCFDNLTILFHLLLAALPIWCTEIMNSILIELEVQVGGVWVGFVWDSTWSSLRHIDTRHQTMTHLPVSIKKQNKWNRGV